MSEVANATEIETRERLVLAGIEDIEKHGFQNLSMRRVAAACGFSCAAPYKHYKNKNEFILAIIQYINQKWKNITDEILKRKDERSTRELLCEISISYVRFLVEHPNFRSIIFVRDEKMNKEQVKEKNSISEASRVLIHEYCKEVNMSREDEVRKTFIVRSLIYGAALMMDCYEMEQSEECYAMVLRSIQREFDIE